MGVGRGAGIFLLLFTWVQILSCAAVQTFPGVQSFSGVLRNLQNPRVWGSVIAAQGLTANRSSGGEKIVLYIVWFAYYYYR